MATLSFEPVLSSLRSCSKQKFLEVAQSISKLSWEGEVDVTQAIAKEIFTLKSKTFTEAKEAFLQDFKEITLAQLKECDLQDCISIVRAVDDLMDSLIRSIPAEESEATALKFITLLTDLFQKIIDKLGNDFTEKLTDLDVARTAFSCRKFKLRNNTLYLKISQLSQEAINKFIPKAIGLFAKGFTQQAAAKGEQYPDFFDKLSYSIKGKRFAGEDLTYTIWAYAYADNHSLQGSDQEKVKNFNQRMLDNLITTNANLGELSPHDLSQILYSLKEFRKIKISPLILDSLCQSIIPKAAEFDNMGLAAAFKNLRLLGQVETLFSLVQLVADKIKKCNGQAVLNIAYALVTLFCTEEDNEAKNLIQKFLKTLWLRIIEESLKNWPEVEFSTIQIVYYASLKILKVTDLKLPKVLEEKIAAYLKSVVHAPSPPHREVYAALNTMGLPYKFVNEHPFISYSIDIADIANKIAIEVDGKDHFVPGTKKRVAKEIVREKLLEIEGWKVIHIPTSEWYTWTNYKRSYLRKKLCEAGLLPPLSGKIDSFNGEFGFITIDNNERIYFNKKYAPQNLKIGQSVEYQEAIFKDKIQAQKLILKE